MNRFEEEAAKLPPPRDGKDFDDAEAWGFCDYCAFDVAVFNGKLDIHRRKRNGGDDSLCRGSDKPPAGPTPVEAQARQMVSIRKDPDRAKSRSFWQRQRSKSREKRRDIDKLVVADVHGKIKEGTDA